MKIKKKAKSFSPNYFLKWEIREYYIILKTIKTGIWFYEYIIRNSFGKDIQSKFPNMSILFNLQ